MNCRNTSTSRRRTSRWRNAGLLAALFAIGTSVQAQVIFNETFTGGTSVTGFSIVQNDGSCGWDYTNPNPRTITGAGFDADFVIFDSDFCGDGLNNSSLLSSAFDASAPGTYELDLSFQYRFCCDDFFDIEVWDGSTWNNVYSAPNASVGYGNPATSLNFDITAASGGSAVAQVRFTYEADFAWWVAMDNIMVTYTAPPSGCIGVPAPGATTGPSSICSGVDFSLGLTNPTTGSGVSYQWYVSTISAVAGFSPVGPEADSFTTSQTVQSWYYCDVTCDDGPDTTPSDVLQVDMNSPAACYCTTLNYTNNNEPMTLVNFAGINNPSCDALNCDGDLIDYTAGTPGAVVAGQTYAITVKGNSDGDFDNYYTAFFDWDQDGVFETSEQIGVISNSTGLDAEEATTDITVPFTAIAGSTRMRVIKDYASTVTYPSDPCGTYDYGQAEDYTINVTVPACTAPDVTVIVTPNCPAGFNVDVDVVDFGDGAGATIQWSLNSLPQTPITASLGSNVLPGTFASGDDVDVTVEHDSDSDCNAAYNNNTYVCPPANDDCGGAIALSVNADFLCGTVTAGTTNAATASVQPDVDSGTPDDDVWFSFVATATTHRVSLLNVSGSTDMGHSVYRALPDPCAPAGMTLVVTSDPDVSNPSGLTIGETYFVRVYRWNAGASNVTFNICIGTPPPPPANDDCGGAIALTVNTDFACGTVTAGTTSSATASVQPDVDSGNPDDDVWYSFVATATTHRVSLLNVSGFADMGHSVYRALPDPCAPAGMTLVSTSDPNESNPAGLTIGETYFVRVYAWGTGTSNVTFDLCIGTAPPPPANDLCSNATMITCNSTVSGSTVAATNTGAPTAGCDNTGDPYVYNAGGRGVWYTVAGFDGTMTASLCGSAFDTQVWIGTTPDCVAMTCVAGNDDSGECSTGSRSYASWVGSSSETYYIYVTGWATASGAYTLSVTCGDNAFACTENGLTLEFQTDANPMETTWELLNEAGDLVVLSGGPLNPANSVETNFACVPDGCYRLRVLDAGGDGMTTGGYILRTTGDNLRIIDNANNFDGAFDGDVSAISGGQTFCVPLGEGRTIFSSCDKLDWVTDKFIVATSNADVATAYATPALRPTSGYEFWFYDPNGSYSYRRFRSHSTSDGYGTGATRACHFRVNAWVNSPGTPHLPSNVLLNVRIRGRVAGVNQAFGPACLFKIDPVLAACPRVNLQDNPLSNDFSCGLNKFFGGSNTAGNRLTATPPQPIPTVLSSNVRYQFRFRIVGEAICIIRPPQTSATFYMNWSAASGPQLECGKQYEVDVRVSLDGGATWCFDSASPSCVEPVTPWGKVCMVNIVNSTYCPGPLQGGSSSLAVQNEGNLTMYPNPNRGDQLFINLSEVGADVNTVSVDIYDLTGKRITARTIQVQDGFVNTAMDLNGTIANGMYMVNITAGDKTYTERLVIQK